MKKIVSLLIIMTIVIGASNTVEAYSGVKSWFVDEIKEADELWRIIPKSFENKDFNVNITRAEFCEVLYSAYFMLYVDRPSGVEENVFVDTNLNHVNSIYHIGLVSGYPDGSFRPDDLITRQEIFKILHKFLVMYKGEYEIDSEVASRILSDVNDMNAVSTWAQDAVAVMKYEGIAGGDNKGNMNPKDNTTIAEGIIMVKRMLDSTLEKKVVLGVDDEEDNGQDQASSLSTSDSTGSTEDSFDDVNDPLNRLGYNSSKAKYVYGDGSDYTTSDEAYAHMVKISVDVWELGSDGQKYTSKKTLTVNEAIAERVKLVFNEIYNGEEKFPIYSVHSYAWRQSSTSEHNQGTAIDINPNENYMIRNGRIVAGLYWKPGEDPYSILPDGDVVNAFAKYGFAWGGNYWRSANDYMHFSYFGR